MSIRDRLGPAVVGLVATVVGVVVVGTLAGLPLGRLVPFGLLLGGLFAAGALLVGILGSR